jgi:Na+-translocating ferredoxin:NAD+ oxidoreductase RnfD subunit
VGAGVPARTGGAQLRKGLEFRGEVQCLAVFVCSMMKKRIAWILFMAFIAVMIEMKGWSRYQEDAWFHLVSAGVIGGAIGFLIGEVTARLGRASTAK